MSVDNLRTIIDFVPNWVNTDPESIDSHIRSIENETHRRPDPCHFLVDEKGILDPITGKYLLEIVTPESHKNPYLGAVERGIIVELNRWATLKNKGYGVWFSPHYEGEYPGHKIAIHQIAYTSGEMQKALFNIYILFDGPKNSPLEIAREIFGEDMQAQEVEDLRGTLFVGEELDLNRLLQLVERYAPTGKSNTPVTEEKITYIRNLIISRENPYRIASEMQRLGVLGPYSISCPGGGTTLSNVMEGNSLVLNFSESAKFVKNCGNCGTSINGLISKGYRCPNCGGVYEGC